MSRFFDELSAARSQRAAALLTTDRSPAHRLAVIGTGMMGREHMHVARLLGRAHIAAIYDPSPQSIAEAIAETPAGLQRPTCYASLDEAFADDSIDGFIISAPNHTHAALARRAMQTGKALLVEKPMATSLTNALDMARAVRDYPAVVQLGMQYRFKAQYVDLFHAVIAAKALGEVKTISVAEYRPPFLDKVAQWNKFSRNSGGTLVEKCCHYFDLINRMADAVPTRVFASGGQAVNFRDFMYRDESADIDDHAFVVIEYDNGVRAQFALNMFCQELYEEMTVVGEFGRARATETASFKNAQRSRASLQVETAGHTLYEGGSLGYPDVIEDSGHYGATFFSQEAFIDRLEGATTDGATAEEGLWAIIVAIAAQESMRRQSVVDVGELLRHYGVANV